MKSYSRYTKVANKASLLAGLLAVTSLLTTALQLRSQTTDAADTQSTAAFGALVSVANHTPRQVLDGRATRLGHYDSQQKLRLTLALTPPHMDQQEKFLKELTTKGSPNFHKFMTADQWNKRFAPSVADEQRVVDWAKSQGFTITNRYANRLLVDVEAPAGTVEKAFGVTLNNYKVGEEVDFANDRDPVMPSTIADVVESVMGLNSIQRFHRLTANGASQKGADYVPGAAFAAGGAHHGNGDTAKNPANRALAQDVNAPPTLSNPPLDNGVADPGNITSSQAYDFDGLHALSHCCNVHGYSTGSPAQSSIALVTYGNFDVNDVTTFFKHYGFAWNLNWYYINGSGYPGQDDEAPLDVEYSTAMANSYGSYLDTAHVFVYEAANNLYATYADVYNSILSNNYAKVVSTSYGWEEGVGFSDSQANSVMHGIFNSMLGQGWTLISAAGDNGASQGCGDALAVLYPASDPDFIAAGGTQLQLDANGNFVSETAWTGETWSGACGSNHGGGGGGLSSNFGTPYWQSPLGYSMRALPDISLTANPDVMGEWYFYNGQWLDEGGTSIVAPELAGFFAQENSYLDYIGNVCGSGSSACTPVGNAAVYMYYDGLDGAPHNPFYDITSGCNSNDVTAYYGLGSYCAGSGYDLATGWGSANMMQLAWGINWELIPAYGSPSISFSGPATGHWYNTNQTVSWSVADAGSGGYPAPGVAGFTQGWDTIPADPQSEPHGGSGNSFYSGPQFPFATTGCLALQPTGCAGGVSQGCHTAWVEAWDNQGRTATSSYGPICFDNVAPTVSALLSGKLVSGAYYSNVVVSLSASDNASGVSATYYQLDGGGTAVYAGAFTVSSTGSHSVKYWSVDAAGNSSTAKTASFKIAAGRPASLTMPTPGSTLAGSSVTFKWSTGTAASDYELWLGTTGVGSKNLKASSKSKSTSLAVTKLPTNGKTIYARLITFFGSVQVSQDYTYKAK